MFWKSLGILIGLIFQFSCQKRDLLKKQNAISLQIPPYSCLKAAHFLHKFEVHWLQLLQKLLHFKQVSLENPVILNSDWPVTIYLWVIDSELEIPDQAFPFFFSTKELWRKSQEKSYNCLETCIAIGKAFLWQLQFKIVPSVSSSSFSAILLSTAGTGRLGSLSLETRLPGKQRGGIMWWSCCEDAGQEHPGEGCSPQTRSSCSPTYAFINMQCTYS